MTPTTAAVATTGETSRDSSADTLKAPAMPPTLNMP
jgi:hypothetical protein